LISCLDMLLLFLFSWIFCVEWNLRKIVFWWMHDYMMNVSHLKSYAYCFSFASRWYDIIDFCSEIDVGGIFYVMFIELMIIDIIYGLYRYLLILLIYFDRILHAIFAYGDVMYWNEFFVTQYYAFNMILICCVY